MKRFVLASAVILALVPGPARASCVFGGPYPQRLDESPLVFVGTVTATSNGGRNATVTVEEIWKGTGIAETVEVFGGAQGANVASSVDRSYETGTRYLFAPYEVSPEGIYRDNICTPTRTYVDKLERLRPDDAVILASDEPSPSEAPVPGTPGPAEDTEDGTGDSNTALWVALGALAAGGAATALWRARRS